METQEIAIKPKVIDCMNCKNYKGLHPVLCKVVCGFKPTSDEMRHRSIEGDTVDCPMILFKLDWKGEQKL